MLLIHPDAPAFADAVGWLTVEDAARADVAAVAVAEARIDGIAHAAGEPATIAFAIDCPTPPRGRSWGVRARVDVAGDRGGAAGDLYSIESVAAAPETGPLAIRVEPSQGAGRWPTPTITR